MTDEEVREWQANRLIDAQQHTHSELHVMNLNPLDIMEMEVPQLPKEKQKEIAAKYKEEQHVFRSTVTKAQDRWKKARNAMYQELLGGDDDGY